MIARALLLLLGLTLSAFGLIDLNENGASDLWEKRFNSDQLFTTFDPQADPDGDGWTNEQEAAAGTDPFDANSPAGFLRPEIEYFSAVYGSPEEEGGPPVLVSPETVSIRWPTIAGKKYTVLSSPDLATTSWVPVGEPDIGSGSIRTAYIPLTQPDGSIPDKLFLRVAVGDTDTDGDTLTDAEENELGSSPYSADGDNDGLSDLDELFVHLTSPNSRDSDGDGVSDWDEIMVNFTDPLSAADADGDGIADDFEKHLAKQLLAFQPDPAAWGSYFAGLVGGNLDPAHAYTSDGMTAGDVAAARAKIPEFSVPYDVPFAAEKEQRWVSFSGGYSPPSEGSSGYSSGAVVGGCIPAQPGGADFFLERADDHLNHTPQWLTGRCQSAEWCAHDTTLPEYLSLSGIANGFDAGVLSGFVSLSSGTGSTQYYGNVRQQRIRFAARDVSTKSYERTYLKVSRVRPFNTSVTGDVVVVEPITLSIPAGALFSAWTDFQAPITVGHETVVSLHPVEVRVRQDNVQGPHGSPPMYVTPKPDDGNAAGELFSLWPAEEAYVTLGGELADIIQAGSPPANLVKWSTQGIADKTNEKEYKVQWGSPGLKEVKLEIGGLEFLIRINIPDTGSIDFNGNASQDGPLIAAIGIDEYIVIGLAGVEIRQRVVNRYGQTGGTGGARQDAIRHSSWNAFGAWHVGVGRDKMIKFSTANEYHGRYSAAAFASNTTMDLHNNDHGATTGGLYMGISTGSAEGWIDTMEQEFDQGKLRIWTPPNLNVVSHFHFLRKSDGKSIFAP